MTTCLSRLRRSPPLQGENLQRGTPGGLPLSELNRAWGCTPAGAPAALSSLFGMGVPDPPPHFPSSPREEKGHRTGQGRRRTRVLLSGRAITEMLAFVQRARSTCPLSDGRDSPDQTRKLERGRPCPRRAHG